MVATGVLAVGAEAPVDDLGLVDDEAPVVHHVQAGADTGRAVHVDGAAAASADQVVVVVVDPVLVQGGRSGGLDAPEDTPLSEGAERVVDRLAGDGTDLGPDPLLDLLGGAVGLGRNGAHHGQPLRGDLKSVTTELLGVVGGTGRTHGLEDYF